MDILLWRWSIAVQLTSAFMIAVFFVTLSRAVRRPEVVWWTRAWLANLVALLFTLVFWYFEPRSALALTVTRGGYLAAKIAFVLLLITGAGVLRLTTRNLIVAIAIYALLGGIFLDSIPLLGLVQHATLAIIFIVTAVILVRDRSRRWNTHSRTATDHYTIARHRSLRHRLRSTRVPNGSWRLAVC